MCLIPDSTYPSQPDGSIRFKLMKLNPDGKTVSGLKYTEEGSHSSEWRETEQQSVGSIRRHTTSHMDSKRAGIHVCPDEESFAGILRWYQEGFWQCRFAKVKLSCRGFMAGGVADTAGVRVGRVPNETWRDVTILEITEVPNR